MLKIPMSAEHEMENQYSISDLEIGKVTIIGIYRGSYLETEIRDKVDKLKALQGKKSNSCEKGNMDDIEDGDINIADSAQAFNIHYIDVIAIVQDLNI